MGIDGLNSFFHFFLIRISHNHHFLYSAAVVCRLFVSMPPTVRSSVYRKVDGGSLTCAIILVRDVRMKAKQALTCLHKR